MAYTGEGGSTTIPAANPRVGAVTHVLIGDATRHGDACETRLREMRYVVGDEAWSSCQAKWCTTCRTVTRTASPQRSGRILESAFGREDFSRAKFHRMSNASYGEIRMVRWIVVEHPSAFLWIVRSACGDFLRRALEHFRDTQLFFRRGVTASDQLLFEFQARFH
jgi:hypothetical protein